MKRKITIVFLTLLLILNSLSFKAYASIEPDGLMSKSAILINSDDRQILFEKNSKDKMAPASITKIMLLVLISEKMDSNELALNQEITISKNAAGMGGSQVFIEENEVQTVENMLKAICLRSANDASVAMAELMYGSEEGCVKVMNDKAKELGMMNTNFKNVTGLPDPDHYTTAYDIAIMTSELLKYNYVNEYLNTWMDSIYVGKNKDIEQVLVNTNRLVNNYQGHLGGKTGYTSEAKYCLSAAARRNDTTLIAVVLGCDDTKVRFGETQKLLNYGFANFRNFIFHKKGEIITNSPVYLANSETFNVISKENISFFTNSNCKIEDFKLEYLLDENLKAPLSEDTVVGKLILSRDNQVLGEYELYPEKTIAKENFVKFYFKNVLGEFIK